MLADAGIIGVTYNKAADEAAYVRGIVGIALEAVEKVEDNKEEDAAQHGFS